MKKVIIALLTLALVGGGIYWFVIREDSGSDTAKKVDTGSTTPTETSKTLGDTTITYTDEGFDPSNYRAGVDETLTIQNNSSSSLDFSSDDHPTHTKNSELNLGVVSAGESKTVKLTTAGVWGFHNHLNSSHAGSITIQ